MKATIIALISIGFLIGLVMATTEFEARPEPEKFPVFMRIIACLSFIVWSAIFYCAGIEYPQLKKRLKE